MAQHDRRADGHGEVTSATTAPSSRHAEYGSHAPSTPGLEQSVDPLQDGDGQAIRDTFDGGRQVLRQMIGQDAAGQGPRPSFFKRLFGRG